ncbi:hypothetical protein ODJ79_25700 [Actinoplanes sp. KI2]|uniref:hypothetical protein n=1 Tax=Actinoplanes sp. KI2 TaxID=2983315 RepID=UPI0021D58C29|nr:hypothetical protein [Actinoplanes sp. KI2]MCU7727137.1 hypothetical protein [Actinoplanes sp. KI2]
MSDVSVLPGTLAVRNLFEDLLGREVTVGPGEPISAEELPTATVAIFTDSLKTYGVLGMDLSLAANAGAALGLLPAGAAEDSIDEEQLFPNLAENVFELCNVLTSLLNRKGGPHIKLYQVVYPGDELPEDARAYLLALGRRIDIAVEINRYGGGKFSLALAF